jgi:hypothetical protein
MVTFVAMCEPILLHCGCGSSKIYAGLRRRDIVPEISIGCAEVKIEGHGNGAKIGVLACCLPENWAEAKACAPVLLTLTPPSPGGRGETGRDEWLR